MTEQNSSYKEQRIYTIENREFDPRQIIQSMNETGHPRFKYTFGSGWSKYKVFEDPVSDIHLILVGNPVEEIALHGYSRSLDFTESYLIDIINKPAIELV